MPIVVVLAATNQTVFSYCYGHVSELESEVCVLVDFTAKIRKRNILEMVIV